MIGALAKRNVFTVAKRWSSSSADHSGGMDLWRKLSYVVAIPAVVVLTINTYLQVTNHPHERPEFIPYEHMRIRTKRFPWGDGNKSLFHNPHSNALPDGYEDDHH